MSNNPRDTIPPDLTIELMNIINDDDLEAFHEFLQRNHISINDKIQLNAQSLHLYIQDHPPIIAVAAFGQAENIFNDLVQKGAKLDISPPDALARCKPLLHYAIAGGDISIIEQCLQLGVDTRDALLPCVRYGYPQLVETIYDQIAASFNDEPIRIFQIGFGKELPPLKLAIKSQDLDTISFVISKIKAYYDESNYNRCTIFQKEVKSSLKTSNALHVACKTKNLEVCQLIINEFPELIHEANSDGQFPFEYSILINGIENEIPQRLFELITTLPAESLTELINHADNSGMTPLHYAAKANHCYLIENLFKCEGINPQPQTNEKKLTPFMLSVINHHFESTSLFLQNETSPADDPIGLLLTDCQKRIPLHFAAKDDWLDGFKAIIETAYNLGSMEFIEQLLCSKDLSGMSPIMWAVVYGSINVFSFLVYTLDSNNEPLFQVFIHNDKVEVTGRNPLHWAAIENQPEIVDIILENKLIEPNEFSTELPVTPLYYAVKNNNKAIIRSLRKHGADPTSQKENSKLQSPLDIAKLEKIKNILMNPDDE